MKILIVGSNNRHSGGFAPFIVEQGTSLLSVSSPYLGKEDDVEVEYFGITGRGIKGYMGNVWKLRRKIKEYQPNIIHAHYGLCGLVACLSAIGTHTPVVTTYHGSDINDPKVLRFSRMAMRMSAHNIFVSQRTMEIALGKDACANINLHKYSLVPCGIDMPKPASELPDMSHVLEPNKYHILFAGAFDNAVKDPELAKEVIKIYNLQSAICNQAQLIELKDYTRDEVNALMYTCDAFLMTSKTEGSPQVIKEAMACGCPIVSTDVGDVKERLSKPMENGQCNMENVYIEGCFVAESREPKELAELLNQALAFGKRTNGRELVVKAGLVNSLVAEQIVAIYNKVLNPV